MMPAPEPPGSSNTIGDTDARPLDIGAGRRDVRGVGSGGGTRTHNLGINSALLRRLSYPGIGADMADGGV